MPDDVADLPVRVIAARHEISLAGCLWRLVRPCVCFANVTDIDEGIEGRLGDGLLGGVYESIDVRGRGVQAVEGVDGVRGGPVDHGRAEGGEGEAGPVLGDVFPGCLLGEGLGSAICDCAICGVLCGFLVCYWIPICFRICVLPPIAFRAVPDGSEGGGQDDALDVRVILLNRG